MEVENHEHNYKKIFDIYFADGNVDVNQILQQPDDQLKVFIKSVIVPGVSDYPPSLRKELETLKLIKRQSYKDIMAGFKKPSRTHSEQRLYELEKLKEMNPKIISPKFETI